MLVPVAPAYLYAQRRAAFVGLVAGVILLGIVLLWKNRRQFMRVVPIIGVVFVAYVGVFWNSSGSLGFPAQAVKSVVAPSQLNARDQSSDQYRVIEHVDVLSTIKANKLLGVGFGQPFYRPIPLPNITVFLLADYMSHNSLLWIWMKAGVFGFLAMLYLFGSAIRTGGRAIRASTDTTDVVLTITSTAFIVMYGVFTYVDISWDAKTMILMAIAFSQIDATIRKVVVEPARRRRARAAADPVLVALSSK
jgi:O-antigen ligase